MKRNLFWLEAALLSLASAWSAVGCLITAFRLPVVLDVQTGLLWCAVCLGSMAIFSVRRSGRLCLLLTLAGLAATWYFLPLQEQLCGVLGSIAKIYDRAYGWGIPEILQDTPRAGTLPLFLVGVLIIESVVCAVLRRRGTVLAVGLLLLPLAACLVVTDTVPEPVCLLVLLVCLCLLLLTESVRAEGQGSRLTLSAVIPVVLAMGLLFHFVPRDTYQNNIAPVRQQILDYVQDLAEQVQNSDLHLPSYDRRRNQVDLSTLPSQPRTGLPVAEISVEIPGSVYLRVQDYDEYTGTSWISSSHRQETISGTGDALGAVVIRELSAQPGMLLPSYPAGNTVLEDGIAMRESGEKVYRFDCVASAMTATPTGSYLKLPEGTAAAARALVQRIAPSGTGIEGTAAAIADFVRGSAAYSRTIQPMPAEAGDFALWFLESAERGYCIHFATAAVVLLRSAGIPARYVTGFRANAIAGQTQRVTSDDAHAWAEYYNYKTWSWTILEATPADPELIPTQPEAATQPQIIPAETTQAPTQPEATDPPPQPEPQNALPAWIPLTLLGMGAIFCAVQLQRILRIRLRQRRQRRGTGNQRALARWAELQLLHRLLLREIPEELEMLAQKAMFSQHTLTREEGNAFLEDARICRAELNAKPWHKRLLYRYWFAVI